MFKILLIILALAFVGFNTLWSSITGQASTTTSTTLVKSVMNSEPADSGLVSSVKGVAGGLLSSVAEIGGVRILEGLPPSDSCGPGIVTVDRVNDFLAALPAEQAGAIAKTLNTTSPVWSAQLYGGSYGVGLCVISENKLVLLPDSFRALTAVKDLAGPIAGALSDYVPGLK